MTQVTAEAVKVARSRDSSISPQTSISSREFEVGRDLSRADLIRWLERVAEWPARLSATWLTCAVVPVADTSSEMVKPPDQAAGGFANGTIVSIPQRGNENIYPHRAK